MLGIYFSAHPSFAATVTNGNILATYGNLIYEVTTSGIVVQAFPVPAIVPFTGRALGDVVYDPAGIIHVRINSASSGACCSSRISSFDLATETWTDTPVSNYNAGGYNLELARLGNTLYTEFDQFNLTTRRSTNVRPFMDFTHPDDRAENLALGRDGYFYATSDFFPAPGIYRIDPVTYRQVGPALTTVNPSGERLHILGMAVNANGDYNVAESEGRVFAFSRDSTYRGQSSAFGRAPADLSLSAEGLLAFGQSSVGDPQGTLVILDQNLQPRAQVTFLSSSLTDAIYTTFIEVPEPPGACIVIAAFATIVCTRNHVAGRSTRATRRGQC